MFTKISVTYVVNEPSNHTVDKTAFNVLATYRTSNLKNK